jgi:hypothetical protein
LISAFKLRSPFSSASEFINNGHQANPVNPYTNPSHQGPKPLPPSVKVNPLNDSETAKEAAKIKEEIVKKGKEGYK